MGRGNILRIAQIQAVLFSGQYERRIAADVPLRNQEQRQGDDF